MTQSTLHVCYRNGAVTSGPIPSDAADFLWTAALSSCGCSRLHCMTCLKPVVVEGPAGNGGRRYVCGCTAWVAFGQRFLDGQPEDALDGGPPRQWGCAGHPARTLPTTLDGVEVAAHPDWHELLTQSMAGELPTTPSWLPDYANAWLERLVATVTADERERFATMVVALFAGAPSPLVAGLDVARRVGLGPVNDEVVRRAAQAGFDWKNVKLARAVVALLRLAEEAGQAEALREALRQALLNVPAAAGFVYRIVKSEPDWLAQNAAKLAQAQPAIVSQLLTALTDDAPAQLPQALDALLSARLGERADIERAIARGLPTEAQPAWSARVHEVFG